MRKSFALTVFFMLLLTPTHAKKRNQSQAATVTGTLVRVIGIGGETTGWAIQLDSETSIQGKALKLIEVGGNVREFLKLENKHLEAVGQLITRHGIERGDWPVLEVSTIREVNRK